MQITDTIAVTIHPNREGSDLILVGMLGVNADSQNVVHYIEYLAAAMKQERPVHATTAAIRILRLIAPIYAPLIRQFRLPMYCIIFRLSCKSPPTPNAA